MVVAGVILLCGARKFEEIAEYWKWIVPIVTTYIGYAIGDKNSTARQG